MQFNVSSAPQTPVALADGADVGASVAATTGGVVGADVASTAGIVGAIVTGRDVEGAGVAKAVGGKVVAGMRIRVSAESWHTGLMIGIVPTMLALAMYSDSVHLFTYSDTIPW